MIKSITDNIDNYLPEINNYPDKKDITIWQLRWLDKSRNITFIGTWRILGFCDTR